MFTVNHFIWIGIVVLFITLLLWISLKFKFSFKVSTLIMVSISLVSETSKICSHMKFVEDNTGMVINPKSLPFHLCSILIFAFIFLATSQNEKSKEVVKSFVVPTSILGGILATLMATSGVVFNEPEPYQCFIYHGGIIWYALYLIMTKQVRFGIKEYIRNLCILIGLFYLSIWINGLMKVYDTNFMFTVRPPRDNLPILNLNHGWYVYILSLVILGIFLVTLIHLPGIIKDIKIKNNNKKLKKVNKN